MFYLVFPAVWQVRRGCGGLRMFVVSGGRVPGVRDVAFGVEFENVLEPYDGDRC